MKAREIYSLNTCAGLHGGYGLFFLVDYHSTIIGRTKRELLCSRSISSRDAYGNAALAIQLFIGILR